MTKVFVYGTLKKGGRLSLEDYGEEHAKLLGNAVTRPQYTMWSLQHFPAVTFGGNTKISGEVWEVSDKVFAELDIIEGYPSFYDRKVIQTSLGKAWMYFLDDYQVEDDPVVEPINGIATWKL